MQKIFFVFLFLFLWLSWQLSSHVKKRFSTHFLSLSFNFCFLTPFFCYFTSFFCFLCLLLSRMSLYTQSYSYFILSRQLIAFLFLVCCVCLILIIFWSFYLCFFWTSFNVLFYEFLCLHSSIRSCSYSTLLSFTSLSFSSSS